MDVLLVILIILLVILIIVILFAQYQYMTQISPSFVVGGCMNTRWGCCGDGLTTKEDQDGTNCIDYSMHLQSPEIQLMPENIRPHEVQLMSENIKPPEVQLMPENIKDKKTPKGSEKFTNYAFI